MRGRGSLGALAALATIVVVAAAFTSAAQGTHAKKGPHPPTAGSCQLGDKGNIKHVIYLQFDNVHFLRDNPNVPSDLEQMPHLLSFLKDNGTFDTNDHTILISHTGGGILSSLTGLYPDRHGQAVSNAYGYHTPTEGRVLVLVQVLDRLHGRRKSGASADAVGGHELQHGQQRLGIARRHRSGAQCAGAVGAVRARGL